MARRALFPIWCYDGDLPEGGDRSDETIESVRENPVVIGAEQAHQLALASTLVRRCPQMVFTMRAESLMPRK